MLSPLNNATSYLYTSSGKLTSGDEQPCPLDHDFFKPVATKNGVSCTYSKDFYDTFRQGSGSTQQSELALLVLDYMTTQDKARLPLFKGASDRYVKQVLPAVQKIIRSEDDDDEILSTKFNLMNCASQFGYLTHPDIFNSDSEHGFVNLQKVSLINMNLRGVNLCQARLNEADLEGADLRKANLKKSILKRARLIRADLREANLVEIVTFETSLIGADLTGADLTRAILFRADLRGAILIRAVLNGAELLGVDLSDADLTGTDLTKAIFRRSCFT